MKPIRIFLVGGPTSALFMAAYYRQENMRSGLYRDVCIIHDKKDLSFIAKKEGDGVENDLYRKIAKTISSEIIECKEPQVMYINMSFKGRAYDRKIKAEYLCKLQKTLKENNIDPCEIKEVYHGNKSCHHYIKYLNPKVRLIGFEHGLSDIRNYLTYYTGIKRIKNFIKTVLGRLFFTFYAYAESDHEVVSLFKVRIGRVNKRLLIKSLRPESVREVADVLVHNDISDKEILSDNRKIAVILLNRLARFSDQKEKHFEFHKDVISHITDQLKQVEPQIDTIILKSKLDDKYFYELNSDLFNCFEGYDVFCFNEICNTNYPLEYYLDIIRPKVVLANTSSGLFYTKALIPEIKTYTFHPYMMECLYKHFGWIFPDYPWVLDIFYNKYRHVFEDILPVELSMEKVSLVRV